MKPNPPDADRDRNDVAACSPGKESVDSTTSGELAISERSVPFPRNRERIEATGILALAQASAVAAALFIHVAALSRFSSDEYAVFGLLLIASAALQAFVAGGIPNARRRSATAATDDDAALPQSVDRIHRVVCLAAAATLPLIALAADGSSLGSAAFVASLAAAVELVVKASAIDPISLWLNGRECYRNQAGLQIASAGTRVLFFAGAISAGWGLVGGMTALAVAAICVGAALRLLKRRHATVTTKVFDSASTQADLQEARRWLRLAGWHDLAMASIPIGHLCLVQWSFPNSPALAPYVACFAATRAAGFLGTAVSGATFPTVAKASRIGAKKTARCEAIAGLRSLATCFAIWIVLGSLSFEPTYRLLRNSDPHLDLTAVVCLLAGGAAFSIWAYLGEMLAASGALRGRLIVTVGAAAISVPATAISANSFGIDAAAVALLTVTLAGAVGCALLVASPVGSALSLSNSQGTIATGLASGGGGTISSANERPEESNLYVPATSTVRLEMHRDRAAMDNEGAGDRSLADDRF